MGYYFSVNNQKFSKIEISCHTLVHMNIKIYHETKFSQRFFDISRKVPMVGEKKISKQIIKVKLNADILVVNKT